MKNIKSIIEEVLVGGNNSSIDIAYSLELAKLDAEIEIEARKLKDEHIAKLEKINREFNVDSINLQNTRRERKVAIAMKYYKLALDIESEYDRNEFMDENVLNMESERFGVCGNAKFVIVG